MASPEPRAPASPYPCCPGWVGPAPGSGGTSLSVLPTAGTQGSPFPPPPSPQSFLGVHGGTRLPVPAYQAQLRARRETPAADEPATSWSPVCARRPAGRARSLSLNTDSLRKCADFCPFAKWGNQGTEGGRSTFPRRPDRKPWSEVCHAGPADRASAPCCRTVWLFCPIPSIFTEREA